MKRTRSKDKEKLSRILSYLVALSTIIGIPAGLYGYFASQHRDSVAKTFQFYKDLQSTQLQADRSLLVSRWNDKAETVQAILRAGNEQEFSNFVESLVADSDASAAFEHLLEYFDEAWACVENSLCDNDAAYALLRPAAEELWSAYGSHVLLVRKKFDNREYGAGLSKMRRIRKSLFNPY